MYQINVSLLMGRSVEHSTGLTMQLKLVDHITIKKRNIGMVNT